MSRASMRMTETPTTIFGFSLYDTVEIIKPGDPWLGCIGFVVGGTQTFDHFDRHGAGSVQIGVVVRLEDFRGSVDREYDLEEIRPVVGVKPFPPVVPLVDVDVNIRVENKIAEELSVIIRAIWDSVSIKQKKERRNMKRIVAQIEPRSDRILTAVDLIKLEACNGSMKWIANNMPELLDNHHTVVTAITKLKQAGRNSDADWLKLKYNITDGSDEITIDEVVDKPTPTPLRPVMCEYRIGVITKETGNRYFLLPLDGTQWVLVSSNLISTIRYDTGGPTGREGFRRALQYLVCDGSYEVWLYELPEGISMQAFADWLYEIRTGVEEGKSLSGARTTLSQAGAADKSIDNRRMAEGMSPLGPMNPRRG